jgi:hypothetical protein
MGNVRERFGMTNTTESDISGKDEPQTAKPEGWLRYGLVAMASVVLGGMATAWWYRKTLIRLRQAEEISPNSHFGISEGDSSDEI